MASSDLTRGPVWQALARVSSPMALGILATLSVGIADAYFLGRLGGDPLAAVGYIYPVTVALTSLAIGLSAGANAAVSQAIGAREDDRDVHRLALHAVGLGLALSLVVAFGFWVAAPWLFPLMGASEAVMTEVLAFTPLWSVSFPFLVVQMTLGAVFRAHGDAVAASVLMIGSAVINVGLNPVLILGFAGFDGFGTAGAAAATLAARVLAMVAAVIYGIRAGYVQRCGSVLEGARASVVRIVDVGAPAAFSNAINPAGMALVTAAVGTLGDAAVAGFGAATRIQSIAIVAMLALSAGIGPVVGQNWGAEKPERAQAAVLQSWAFCIAYGVALGMGLYLGADTLANWIASGADAARYTADYLRIVGWSLAGYGVLVTANAAMNARSMALYSMGLSLGRILALYLPLAWLGVWMAGYTGILLAAVVANLGAVLGAVWCCARTDLLPRRWRAVIPAV